MPKAHKPGCGTMQFWHRKRAKRIYARVRSWPAIGNDVKPLGFAGYKVGMTHVIATDNRQTSMTKNADIFMPATIIECPPLKIASVVFYKKSPYGSIVSSAIISQKLDKELGRKICIPKKYEKSIEQIKSENYDDIRVLVYTQPRLTSIGKKKPELFELALGGKMDEKIAWVKSHIGGEILLSEAFSEGQRIDVHAITKGKGIQGPVRRNGVAIRQHKSEKSIRAPASLGAWCGQGHIMYRVAHAGQHGFHQRTELNKWLIKIGKTPAEINPKSGFKRYGIVKNQYILLKGSVQGPSKRMIIMTNPLRACKKIPKDAPQIQYVDIA